MAAVSAADSLPRLITKPLAKISHATVSPERPVPEWLHFKERDDLVIVLDHVRVLAAPQQYVERRVIRVVCGAELVAYLDLDERMRHPSMDPYRQCRGQIPLDQLPFGVLVRPPNLRIVYATGASQKRLLQLKFISELDCQEMATNLERLGLPVRPAVSSDRSGSQRPNTATTWSATPSSSESRTLWSSHETTSSQTLNTSNSSQLGEQAYFASQQRQPLPLPELSSTRTSVVPSAIPSITVSPASSSSPYLQPASSHLRPATSALEHAVYQPSGQLQPQSFFAHSNRLEQAPINFMTGGAGELVERYSLLSSPQTHQQAPLISSRNRIQGTHGGQPAPSSPTSRPNELRLACPPWSSQGRLSLSAEAVQPPPALPFAAPHHVQLDHRPWTAQPNITMVPSPVLGTGANQGATTKNRRAAAESPVTGRRITRLAAKRLSNAPEEAPRTPQFSHSNAPISPSHDTSVTPAGQVPFATPRLNAPSAVAASLEAVRAPLTEEAAPAERVDAQADESTPAAVPAPQDAGKKPAKRGRKPSAKTTRPATGQAKKQTGRKGKTPAKAPTTNQPQAGKAPEASNAPAVGAGFIQGADSRMPAPGTSGAVEGLMSLSRDNNPHPLPALPPAAAGNALAPLAAPPCVTQVTAGENAAVPVAAAEAALPTPSTLPDPPPPPPPPPSSPPPPTFSFLSSPPPSSFSREDAEAFIDQRVKHSLGTYFAQLGPHMADLDNSVRQIANLTKQFASSS